METNTKEDEIAVIGGQQAMGWVIPDALVSQDHKPQVKFRQKTLVYLQAEF